MVSPDCPDCLQYGSGEAQMRDGATHRGERVLLAVLVLPLVVLGLGAPQSSARADDPRLAAHEAWQRLQEKLPELFEPPRGDGEPKFSTVCEGHSFAWAIAVDCRQECRQQGTFACVREMLLNHLFRSQSVMVSGDLVGVYYFGAQAAQAGAEELSLVGDIHQSQMKRLRDNIPTEDELASQAQEEYGGSLNAWTAAQECMQWLAAEYRRGWRHLAMLLLTDDLVDFQAQRQGGRSGTYLQLPRGLDLGLPAGPASADYLLRRRALEQEDTRSPVACVWLIVTPAEEDEGDAIDFRLRGTHVTTRSGLLKALAPAWGRIRGTLQDADGKALTTGTWVSAGPGLTASSSSSDGTYNIAVPEPGTYTVTVADANRIAKPSERVVRLTDRAEIADGVDFVVEDAGTSPCIEGRVLTVSAAGEEGNPAPLKGARVMVKNRGGSTVAGPCRTDRGGVYRFSDLRPGDYLVSATSAGTQREVSCYLAQNTGRMIAPSMSLPRPVPWSKLVAAAVAAALLLAASVYAGMRKRILVVAPEHSDEGGPRLHAVGPLARSRVVEVDGTGEGGAIASRMPFATARLRVRPPTRVLSTDERELGQKASLAQPVVVEHEGRRWRVSAARPRRRYATPNPGTAGLAEGLEMQTDTRGFWEEAAMPMPTPAAVPPPLEVETVPASQDTPAPAVASPSGYDGSSRRSPRAPERPRDDDDIDWEL